MNDDTETYVFVLKVEIDFCVCSPLKKLEKIKKSSFCG